jgi:hypothetical protein
MRFLYLLLKILINYPVRMFYPRQKLVNRQRRFLGRTIYVSNHAASFMDPLVLGTLQRPIVFFMTRSDVFTPMLKPILWLVHMLPIYRQHDGEDTKQRNGETFEKCTRVLSSGRNLLIFGEGFTDDVFIRRLKPVKKGAARIGFGTLEAMDWKKKVYVVASGVNYGDPNYLRSDLLISHSERLCLNDYRAAYELNRNKTINEVTKQIELLMQAQIAHVANLKWVFFHEHVARLLRFGMHPEDTDLSIPLRERWENSRHLALWMNTQELDEQPELLTLKNDLEAYFSPAQQQQFPEKYLSDFATAHEGSRLKEMAYLLLAWPIALLGLIHAYVPYVLIKRFVEKTFRRRVFWSSVKMMLGAVAISLWNIPLVILLNKFVIHDTKYTLAYYLMTPFAGLVAYIYARNLAAFRQKGRLQQMDLTARLQERSALIARIRQLVKL